MINVLRLRLRDTTEVGNPSNDRLHCLLHQNFDISNFSEMFRHYKCVIIDFLRRLTINDK